MFKKKVVVIIINYQTSHLIQKLIDSINESNIDVSILVVDNATTEESYNELLAIIDKRLEIIRSKKNLGFAGGINYALKYIIENNPKFDYFFLLNPDAFSTDNLISDLTQVLDSNKDAAAISPQILHLNGSPWYTGGMIRFTQGQIFNQTIDETKCQNEFFFVDVFCGCAVLLDFKKVIEAGMFNDDLFMYFDEADLSIRLKQNGHKILYSPCHKILHDVSYTTRKISHLKTYYMTRNKFIVFNKDMSLYNKLYFLLHEFLYHLKNRRLKNAYYHIKGYYDFLKGKSGPLTTQ